MKIDIYGSFRRRTAILKDRERQIRETEELLRTGRKLSTALESLPVGVLIVDVEGRICQINEQVSRICKMILPAKTDSYGEILGWLDSNGNMIRGKNSPLYRAIHRGDSSHNESIQIQGMDGTNILILGSASPLLGLDGHVVGAVVIIQDVTEPKKIGKDLENRIANLISAGLAMEETINH